MSASLQLVREPELKAIIGRDLSEAQAQRRAQPKSALEPLELALNADRLVGEFVQAADETRRRSALDEAKKAVGDAIKALGSTLEHEVRGVVLTVSGDTAFFEANADSLRRALGYYRDAGQAFEDAGNAAGAARAYYSLAHAYEKIGTPDAVRESIGFARRALRACDSLSAARESQVGVVAMRALRASIQGQLAVSLLNSITTPVDPAVLDEAQTLLRDADSYWSRDQHPSLWSQIASSRAMILARHPNSDKTYLEESVGLADDAISLASQAGDVGTVAHALAAKGIGLARLSAQVEQPEVLDRAVEVMSEAKRFAESIGAAEVASLIDRFRSLALTEQAKQFASILPSVPAGAIEQALDLTSLLAASARHEPYWVNFKPDPQSVLHELDLIFRNIEDHSKLVNLPPDLSERLDEYLYGSGDGCEGE